VVTRTSSLPLVPPDSHPYVWLEALKEAFSPDDVALLERTLELAISAYDETPATVGSSQLRHALGTAGILADMRLDADAVAAGLLHAWPGLEQGDARLKERVGVEVYRLAQGAARMALIDSLTHEAARSEDRQGGQAEALRQMLLAMVEDVRVVLIKLAERCQALRYLVKSGSPQRGEIAQAVRELYAPLANRLGIWQLKWELEDLSTRILEPDTYHRIASLLDEKRRDRERYIEEVSRLLGSALAEHGVHGAEISGRPKHIASIVGKMRRKRVGFEQIFDVRAVRVMVPEIKDCYTVLGIAHHLWQPIPGEFDDYIANPKGNDYRSLHTAVIGPEGKALEVQIRTFDMHQHAELGVASHWRYKEGGKGNAQFEERIAWLRQILAWREDMADEPDMAEQFQSALFQDVVYVLTPQGRVVDLPQGATPLDFAYALHTELGHRCRGARVDGNMVTLNTPMKTGQRVEIITTKQGAPSRDWLNPHLGYLKTSRARSKVRYWFKHLHFDENVAAGRQSLDKELQRMGLAETKQDKLAERFGYPRTEEFLAALGRGEIGTHQIAAHLEPERTVPPVRPRTAPRKTVGSSGGIYVEGVGAVDAVLAGCCKPRPPDAIVAYTTVGRGVTVHRLHCPTIRRLPEQRRARVMEANWGEAPTAFLVEIHIHAWDRRGLLRDIGDILADEKINVMGVNTKSEGGEAGMDFSLEIRDLPQLSRAMHRIQQIHGVTEAARRH
jgi:GTP pyrophosphokinase